MSFLEHLDELRRRLVASVLSLLAGMIVAFFFIDRIFDFIMRRCTRSAEGVAAHLHRADEAFMLKVKIALLAGLVIAAPLIMTQLWLFIAPACTPRKKFALPFIVMASLFFVAGPLQSLLLFPSRDVPRRFLERLHDVHARIAPCSRCTRC